MEVQVNDWLKLSTDSGVPNIYGEPNDVIVSRNTSNSDRSDTFDVKASSLTETLSVTQKGVEDITMSVTWLNAVNPPSGYITLESSQQTCKLDKPGTTSSPNNGNTIGVNINATMMRDNTGGVEAELDFQIEFACSLGYFELNTSQDGAKFIDASGDNYLNNAGHADIETQGDVQVMGDNTIYVQYFDSVIDAFNNAEGAHYLNCISIPVDVYNEDGTEMGRFWLSIWLQDY